ncbi:MAG: large conductance mechanosensitive channel protein [Myxococcaceae bacterium]|nr:large conductance mechanosensitive channel protein [Myxococcaceae bacterium]
MASVLTDFRNFIGKGNAVDLAVGLIIGSAIGTILKSFVDELVIPLTGLVSKVDFSNMYFVLKGDIPEGTPLAEARKAAGVVALGYGQFVTVLLNTLILAFAVFLVVRSINKLKAALEREEKAALAPAPATPPAPPADVVLLTEIRDLLKAQRA